MASKKEVKKTQAPDRQRVDLSEEYLAPDGHNSPIQHMGLGLLEVADPSDMLIIRMNAKLNDYVLTYLSPTEALVLPEHSNALVDALLAAGYAPRVV